MKLFDKDNKEETPKDAEDKSVETQNVASVQKTSAKKDTKASSVQKNVGEAYDISLIPIVTEKAHALSDNRTYTFAVHKAATKPQIKRAVETLHDVAVEKVRALNMPVRHRTIGRNQGYKKAFRKALVTVKEGDKIDFFEGV